MVDELGDGDQCLVVQGVQVPKQEPDQVLPDPSLEGVGRLSNQTLGREHLSSRFKRFHSGLIKHVK